MIRRYLLASLIGATGVGMIGWTLFAGSEAPPAAMFVAAAAAPASVLAAAWGRLGGRIPIAALLAGALLAPVIAVAGHPIVAGFMAAFVSGFADSGSHLIGALRADPTLATVLTSPWVLVLIVELVTVAPLVEEFAKALGAVISRPTSRREAFLFGIAAGAGFAIVENVLYAVLGIAFGSPWPEVAVTRSIGAAVHPLACGLVMLGWWDWRQTRRVRSLARGYLLGVGVHALWNGSLAVVAIVESASAVGGNVPSALRPLGLAYAGTLGVVMAAVLGMVTANVAGDRPERSRHFQDGRTLAAWIILSASLLVPVSVLVLAFPAFYRG